MKAFIVFAHPEPKSFNAALFRTAREALAGAGWEVRVSDLHAMGFNPVSDRRNFTTVKDPDTYKQQVEELHATGAGGFAPDLEEEMAKLEWCDLFIMQTPLWWFGLPAMLKGWADRVLAMGRFYGDGRFYEQGVLRGRRALLSLTTGGPPEAYEKGGFNGDIQAILRPILRGICEFVGLSVLAPNIVYAPAHITAEERAAALAAYAARLGSIEKEEPMDVGQY